MNKRKIILNIAISLDGYICDEDGGFDWMQGDGDTKLDTKRQFNFAEFLETVDTVVMGKEAYLDNPPEGMDMLVSKKIFVATTGQLDSKPSNVETISGDICDQVLKLREQAGKDIWLFGGSKMLIPFLKANAIDEYIIGIIPTILGKGRRLFLGDTPMVCLSLEEYSIQEGIVIVRYSKR